MAVVLRLETTAVVRLQVEAVEDGGYLYGTRTWISILSESSVCLSHCFTVNILSPTSKPAPHAPDPKRTSICLASPSGSIEVTVRSQQRRCIPSGIPGGRVTVQTPSMSSSLSQHQCGRVAETRCHLDAKESVESKWLRLLRFPGAVC